MAAIVQPEFAWHEAGTGIRIRLARWPAAEPARGTVLLLPGRSEFIEKYSETAGDLLSRGFDVRALEWRGQGLSSRLTAHPQRGHVESFEHYLEDMFAVIDRVIAPVAPNGKLVLLGHSMAGPVVLRALAERPDLARAAVLTAPMLGLIPGPTHVLARTLARLAVRSGLGRGYALGQKDWRAPGRPFHGNPLCSDPARYAIYHQAFAERRDLRLGGVTWGWLDASFRAMDHVMRPAVAQRISTPVMLACAGIERIVDRKAQHRLAQRLPKCTFKLYPDSRHEILMECDAIRNRFLHDFDEFLERAEI